MPNCHHKCHVNCQSSFRYSVDIFCVNMHFRASSLMTENDKVNLSFCLTVHYFMWCFAWNKFHHPKVHIWLNLLFVCRHRFSRSKPRETGIRKKKVQIRKGFAQINPTISRIPYIRILWSILIIRRITSCLYPQILQYVFASIKKIPLPQKKRRKICSDFSLITHRDKNRQIKSYLNYMISAIHTDVYCDVKWRWHCKSVYLSI